jgi:transcriptional regulator with XRE-family HTH domain
MKAAGRPIDRHIGKRLRAIRHSRQMSLETFADHVGLEVRLLRSYEAGERIKAEALCTLARALNVPIAGFFSAPTHRAQMLDELSAFASHETALLLQAWEQLDMEERHKALLAVQLVAGPEDLEPALE